MTNPPTADRPRRRLGFEEGSGTTAADSSGGATTARSAAARPGRRRAVRRALSFDGVNDWVTVPDADSLDLTTGDDARGVGHPTALSELADGR